MASKGSVVFTEKLLPAFMVSLQRDLESSVFSNMYFP